MSAVPVGPYVQTERRGLYKEYAELLIARGHAYRCFCDKDDAAEENVSDGAVIHKYDGRCSRLSKEEIEANLAAGKPYVIRQKIPREGKTTFHDEIFGDITVDNDTLDDQVLIKRDGLPTYNFANVVDDHLMGITHVVRGSEYLSSTPKYNLLYEGFGWEIPKYIHCSPVMRDQHNKMSKRHGDPSYEDLIAQGYLSQAVVNYVALLGWAPGGEREIYSLPELVETFDIKGISKSPAIFDIDKLRYFNSEYLRAMTPEQFAAVAAPYIRQTVHNPAIDPAQIAALLQQRCEVLTDIPEKVDFFDALPEYDLALYTNKKSKTDPAVSLEMLHAVRPLLAALPTWDDETLLASMKELAERLEVKNAKVMWPVRIAVSGRAVSARRRGGDLPHPRPGRDPAPDRRRHRQAGRVNGMQKTHGRGAGGHRHGRRGRAARDRADRGQRGRYPHSPAGCGGRKHRPRQRCRSSRSAMSRSSSSAAARRLRAMRSRSFRSTGRTRPCSWSRARLRSAAARTSRSILTRACF